jgi:acyl transferase domain-containing protein
MAWREILSILETELANFSDPPERLKSLRDWKQYASRGAAIDASQFYESEHRKTVDTACLQFAETRTWPQVDQEQLFWIERGPRSREILSNLQKIERMGLS